MWDVIKFLPFKNSVNIPMFIHITCIVMVKVFSGSISKVMTPRNTKWSNRGLYRILSSGTRKKFPLFLIYLLFLPLEGNLTNFFTRDQNLLLNRYAIYILPISKLTDNPFHNWLVFWKIFQILESLSVARLYIGVDHGEHIFSVCKSISFF